MAELVLDDNERETLERWARRPKSAQALALRCRIVLACADGGSNTEVAERLGGLTESLPAGITGGMAPVTTPLGEMYMFTVEAKDMSLAERRSLLDWVIRPALRPAAVGRNLARPLPACKAPSIARRRRTSAFATPARTALTTNPAPASLAPQWPHSVRWAPRATT